ncbi:hypothetical protein GOC13_07340 [Sinorhizobium meliloti]|nr:hypothetical protein [Sinorhizobium meliloti]
MTKVFFQDKAGNAPIVAAFVPFREAKQVMQHAVAELQGKGVSILVNDGQRIVAANGAKYWLG